MIDKQLYWSLQGNEQAPTKKVIKYANIVYPQTLMRLAIGVYDDDKFTELNRKELEFHVKHGAIVTD